MGLLLFCNCRRKFKSRGALDRHREYCKDWRQQRPSQGQLPATYATRRFLNPLQPLRTIRRRLLTQPIDHEVLDDLPDPFFEDPSVPDGSDGEPHSTDVEFFVDGSQCSPRKLLSDFPQPLPSFPQKDNGASSTAAAPSSAARSKTLSSIVVNTEVQYCDPEAQLRFGGRAGRPAGAPLRPEKGPQRETHLPFGRAQASLDRGERPHLTDRDFLPFASAQEYAFARWAVKNYVSKTALKELLRDPDMEFARTGMNFTSADAIYETIEAIPYGIPSDSWREQQLVVDSIHTGGIQQTYKVYYRGIEGVIRHLVGFPPFASQTRYCPVRQYNADGHRVYSHFFTADWVWDIQEQIDREDATIIPLKIYTDETQLAGLVGQQTAWVVYLQYLGHDIELLNRHDGPNLIPIAFLPKIKDDLGSNNQARDVKAELYHQAMRVVLHDLKALADGTVMLCADGFERWCVPIIAGIAADYPEQVKITGVRSNQQCVFCTVRKTDFDRLYLDEAFQSTLHARTHSWTRRRHDFQEQRDDSEASQTFKRRAIRANRLPKRAQSTVRSKKKVGAVEELCNLNTPRTLRARIPHSNNHQGEVRRTEICIPRQGTTTPRELVNASIALLEASTQDDHASKRNPDDIHVRDSVYFDMPYVETCDVMMIDILHAWTKGPLADTIQWITKAVEDGTLNLKVRGEILPSGKELLDRRFRAIQPRSEFRTFKTLSDIKHWQGKWQRAAAHQIVAAVTPLFLRQAPEYILFLRALVDFHHLAYSRAISEDMLWYMQEDLYVMDIMKYCFDRQRKAELKPRKTKQVQAEASPVKHKVGRPSKAKSRSTGAELAPSRSPTHQDVVTPHIHKEKWHAVAIHSVEKIKRQGSFPNGDVSTGEHGHKEVKGGWRLSNKDDESLIQVAHHLTRRHKLQCFAAHRTFLEPPNETVLRVPNDEDIHNTKSTQRLIDLDKLGWMSTVFDRSEPRARPPGPPRFFRHLHQVAVNLSMPQMISAVGLFIEQCRKRALHEPISNRQLDRYSSKASWANQVWVGLHSRLTCFKPTGSTAADPDRLEAETIHCSYRWRGRRGVSRRDFVWLQEWEDLGRQREESAGSVPQSRYLSEQQEACQHHQGQRIGQLAAILTIMDPDASQVTRSGKRIVYQGVMIEKFDYDTDKSLLPGGYHRIHGMIQLKRKEEPHYLVYDLDKVVHGVHVVPLPSKLSDITDDGGAPRSVTTFAANPAADYASHNRIYPDDVYGELRYEAEKVLKKMTAGGHNTGWAMDGRKIRVPNRRQPPSCIVGLGMDVSRTCCQDPSHYFAHDSVRVRRADQFNDQSRQVARSTSNVASRSYLGLGSMDQERLNLEDYSSVKVHAPPNGLGNHSDHNKEIEWEEDSSPDTDDVLTESSNSTDQEEEDEQEDDSSDEEVDCSDAVSMEDE